MELWEHALVGSILGDGCVWTQKHNNKTAFLYIKYNSKLYNYLKWLKEMLSQGLHMYPIKVHKTFGQYYCYSVYSEKLMKWRKIFYPEGKKIIPKNIKNLLIHPLSLAIWYQDDGCLDYREKYHCNSKFATYCFTYDECKLLSKTLLKNFGVKTEVHKSTMRGKTQYHIYVYSQSMNLFFEIIKKYIHSAFKYKINIRK